MAPPRVVSILAPRAMRLAVAVAPCVVLSIACTDFATPAELEKPTILAVTADPPVVAAGGDARLDTVVVDGSGVLTGLTTSYRLVETYAGVAPIGRLAVDGGVTRYVAPDEVPTLPGGAPPIDTVEVTIDGAGDRPMTALKAMAVAPAATANPTIARLGVGDGDGLAGPLRVRHGDTLALEVATDPPADEAARFAWYTVAGEIERYQSNPCELIVGDEARSGWLFVVVRDGKGGVAWRGVELQVE